MLQITDGRERLLVSIADAALGAVRLVRQRRTRPAAPVKRILVLRLERIGDLMMSLPALAEIRRHAPDAEVDLVVGDWNRPLARCIAGVTRIESMDAPWLSREPGRTSMMALMVIRSCILSCWSRVASPPKPKPAITASA